MQYKLSIWLLIVVPILIILLGFLVIGNLDKTSRNLALNVQALYSEVQKNQWSNADTSIEKIKATWKNTSGYWAVLIDHLEIDEISLSITRLTQYTSSHNQTLSLAESAQLLELVKHIPDKEKVNIINIL